MLSECCGDYERAREYHERDLVLRRALNDPRGVACAQGNLSINASHRKDYDGAEVYGQASLAQYQLLEDRHACANILTNLGAIASYRAEYREAERLYREALAEYRALFDSAGSGDALHNIGEILLSQGQPAEAQPYFCESLFARRTVGNAQRIATTVTHLAVSVAPSGDHARVCLLWGAASHLRESGGIPDFPENRQYQATLASSRAAVGEEQFQALRLQSRHMNARQVIDFVLSLYPALPR